MTSEQQKLLKQLAELGEVKLTTYANGGSVKIITNYLENNSEEFEFTREEMDDLPDCDFIEQKTRPIDPELLKEYQYAYGKLAPTEPAYLSKGDYIKWLDRFGHIFKNLGFYVHPEEKHYRKVYNSLYSLIQYFEYEEEAQKALLEFEIIDKENEIEVLHWLVNYEDLGWSVFMMDVDFYDSYRYFQGDFVSVLSVNEVDYEHKVYFDLRDFEVLINFQKIHNSCYFEMLEKYKLDTNEQIENVNQSSLAYILRKRGLIE